MSDRKDVFTVVKSSKDEAKSFWFRIGTAFANKDGSLHVYLNALPVNGELHIREAKVTTQPTTPTR